MAKIAYSAIVNAVRGAMGTDVFTASHYGPTARIRVAGRNPKSSAQTFVRGNLSKASKAYEGMTPTQRNNWIAYGQTVTRHNPVTGHSTHATGIDAFVELAAKFLQVTPAGTIPMTPPTSEFTGDTITLTASTVAGKVIFSASGANAAGVTTELLLQKLPSQNRMPSEGAYRSQGFNIFTVDEPDFEVSVSAGYYAAAYRFVKVATGQMTELVQLPLQTVAFAVELGGASEGEANQPAPKKKAA